MDLPPEEFEDIPDPPVGGIFSRLQQFLSNIVFGSKRGAEEGLGDGEGEGVGSGSGGILQRIGKRVRLF